MVERKGKNNSVLPVGEYKVIEIPQGRRTFVLVKKAGSSDIYQFFFRGFMRRYYHLGTILQSDGVGGIEIEIE